MTQAFSRRSPFRKIKLVTAILSSSFALSMITVFVSFMYLVAITDPSSGVEQYHSLIFNTIYIRTEPSSKGVHIDISVGLLAVILPFLFFTIIISLCVFFYKKFIKNKKTTKSKKLPLK
ncbi:MAG: hypothetical protein NKF37_02580 [Tropheryma whipplei]|uniref:hypothetical protein n=1 Tax=Tropheryma whipplei TaxID=2039 RepID=UPI000000C791|nr:hypothetical protein [Tropheryma whipplei]MCO8190412.1 hypothetical protein [Tropheryma whipplei]CAD66790.1 putative integral membrane protein [Tropheryma whipplei TW08/27]